MSLEFNPYTTKCRKCNSYINIIDYTRSNTTLCKCGRSWFSFETKNICIALDNDFYIRLIYACNELRLIHWNDIHSNQTKFIASNFTIENVVDKIIKLNNIG